MRPITEGLTRVCVRKKLDATTVSRLQSAALPPLDPMPPGALAAEEGAELTKIGLYAAPALIAGRSVQNRGLLGKKPALTTPVFAFTTTFWPVRAALIESEFETEPFGVRGRACGTETGEWGG